MSGQNGTAAAAVQRYVEDSSMGGVRSAARSNVFLKIIWILSIIVCAVIMVYSLYRLHHHHSQLRHSVTSYTNDAAAQDFPAVTVCNVNPVVGSALYGAVATRRKRTYADLTMLAEFLRDYKNRKMYSRSEEDSRLLRYEYQTLIDRLSARERENIGHNLQLMLTHCKMGDVPCDFRNFTGFYHHIYGNCFTFVADPNLLKVTKTGPQHGLTLQLNTESYDYTVQDEAGFVVVTHRSRDTAFPAEEGVFVPEGNAGYIALTKAMKTDSSSSNCNSNDRAGRSNIYAVDTKWRYSQRGCQHGCLQKEVYRQCGCCDMDLPCPASFVDPSRPPTTTQAPLPPPPLFLRTARQTQTRPSYGPIPRCMPADAEERCLRRVIQTYANGNLQCQMDCVPRCSVTSYSRRFSMTTLLSTSTNQQGDVIFPQPTEEQAQAAQPPMAESPIYLWPEDMERYHITFFIAAKAATLKPITRATSTTQSPAPITPTTTTTTRRVTATDGSRMTTTSPMVTYGPGMETTPSTYTEGSGSVMRTTPPTSTDGSGSGMGTTIPTALTQEPEVPAVPAGTTKPTDGGGSTSAVHLVTPGYSPPPFTFDRETVEGPVLEEGDLVLARRRRNLEYQNRLSLSAQTTNGGQVRVHVYFEDLRCDVTETSESSDWVQVMADIGGIASLWLGLSVLGVLEVLHLLIQLVLVGCGSLCGSTRSTPVKPYAPSSTDLA